MQITVLPRRKLAATLAGAVTGALVLLGATPALAQDSDSTVHDQLQYTFSSPTGTNWTVPADTDVVYVGLRGGNGGNAAQQRSGGTGDSMVVRIPVHSGDVLTLHAGHSATGKTSDQRDGGLGFINGGTGGTGSVDGKNAGGGGGAAAVLVNGKLAAVAAGGGGNGGNGGTGGGHGAGGVGGNIADGTRTAGANGGGGHPGEGGALRTLSETGTTQKGTNAANSSASGGGGGGGAGWPSGSAGTGGKRAGLLFGNSGGGGGAAGVSTITGLVPDVTLISAPMPNNFDRYRGPVAEAGTVKVVIPQIAEPNNPVPAPIAADSRYSALAVSPQLASGPNAGSLASGTVSVDIDGENIGSYSSASGFNNRATSGAQYYLPDPFLPRLAAGTHTVTASYTGSQRPGDYDYPEERSSRTFTFEALPRFDGRLSLTSPAVVGNPVSVDTSQLQPALTTNELSFVWYRGSERMTGVTGASYTPTENDVNRKLMVTVTSAAAFGYFNSNTVTVSVAPVERATRIVPEAQPTEAVAAYLNQLNALPQPVSTLHGADEVAAVSLTYAALSDADRETITAEHPEAGPALSTAQQQAQQVNHGAVGSAVQAASDELSGLWNIRLRYTPRTSALSPDIVGPVIEQLAADGRTPVTLYDLDFVDTLTGDAWTPTTPVQVTFLEIPVADLTDPTVIHQRSDGTLETLPATFAEGTVSFTATSFSLFGVAAPFTAAPDGRDTDGDGIPNSEDSDADGDGIPNSEDDDVNGDGVPNGQDGDVDGDGVPNGRDTDVDGDGTPNGQDNDIDGDGSPNSEDIDMDGDGIPNALDPDENGDGISEVTAAAPHTDGPLNTDTTQGTDASQQTASSATHTPTSDQHLARTGQPDAQSSWLWAGGLTLLLAGAATLLWRSRSRAHSHR